MAKLVFCEDEEKIQKLIKVILSSTPHDVYIASNGLEGLELIERVQPDIIFADISMPVMDGIQLAREIKARPHLTHLPLIFMTAFAQRLEIEEGYRSGAAGYITKPFSLHDLLAQIEMFAPVSSHQSHYEGKP